MSETSWTILKVLEWTTERFAKAGLGSPRLDAQVLLAHVLGCERMQLYTGFDKPLAAEELGAYRELIKRRLGGQPVAYLVGEQEFWSLPFHVDASVLIPRHDTETVIEVILGEIDRGVLATGEAAEASASGAEGAGTEGADEAEAAASEPRALSRQRRRAAMRIADVATGSGAIAVTLARELPGATVVATDISAQAAAVARKNAERNQVADRVEIRVGDLLEPLVQPLRQPSVEPLEAAQGGAAQFDVLVSNPPYVPSGDIAGLSAEVRAEPRLALDGGADGLALLRRIIADAARHVRVGGLLVLEHGFDQAEPVAALIGETGRFAPAELRRDLGKNPRVTFARRVS